MSDNEENKTTNPEKSTEAGIIYLSSIPVFMSVKKIREIFSQYGKVDRIFLQPKDKKSNKKNNRFTEGWVEFANKKIAKRVASHLNNTQVGGNRRSKYYDCLWTIKYLHRFRWTHLSERLSYEKAVHEQRMRTEIAQAKRETEHYVRCVAKKKRKQKNSSGQRTAADTNSYDFRQNLTEDETKERLGKKIELGNVSTMDRTLLSSVFGGNTD